VGKKKRFRTTKGEKCVLSSKEAEYRKDGEGIGKGKEREIAGLWRVTSKVPKGRVAATKRGLNFGKKKRTRRGKGKKKKKTNKERNVKQGVVAGGSRKPKRKEQKASPKGGGFPKKGTLGGKNPVAEVRGLDEIDWPKKRRVIEVEIWGGRQSRRKKTQEKLQWGLRTGQKGPGKKNAGGPVERKDS